MDKNYIKSAINVLINNKTLFGNMLIITLGGTIGLLLKALNVNTNPFELFLTVLGLVLSFVFIYILLNISQQINDLLLKLKGANKNE